jgi:4-hydroxy-tetrahydrodipicolinate synthase
MVRAAAELPGVVGLKDSSADMIYFHELQSRLEDRPDFSLLIGPETLLAETILLGGHGGVCGGANLLPRLYVDLYQAAYTRDLARVAALHSVVMRLDATLYRVGQYESSFLKGVKCALSLLGICSDFLAEPFHRFREPQREIIRKYISEFGITRDGIADSG